ncbi:MAG: WbqC family protein [Bacteroidales bacterium]|jgi:hypothetical protein|nr:WbqC family protein [Bacteroidales bacterium]
MLLVKTVLLSTAYFAPVRYYSKLLANRPVTLERHENFNRQTYRNRCTISTANGLLDLVVPVLHETKPKIPVTQIRIAYHTPWQKLHSKAIESAYRRSPFYEYYMDDLMPFFTERHVYLYDLNLKILRTVCRLANIPLHITESDTFAISSEVYEDRRNDIHPKAGKQSDDPSFSPAPYTQVFQNKSGFLPDLSILDLLFNAGPDTRIIIERSIIN